MNADAPVPQAPPHPRTGQLLVASIFLIAIAGLVFELIAGALSSYLLGDSVTQFSIVIGLFLSAMGVGSFLSKFVRTNVIAALILVEAAVGIVGGLTALVGFAAFAYTAQYSAILLSMVFAVGVMVGLEIPLVIRILQDHKTLRITLANVLGADYLGALAASLLFPFLLLPNLGLVQSGALMGLLNLAVAGLLWFWFRDAIGKARTSLGLLLSGGFLALLGVFFYAPQLTSLFEARLYQDEIIYSTTTPYQRIVITRWRDDVRLFLDGHLQFSSIDEYRYHETLVHPAMALLRNRERILILGGGDGLAAREILQYEDVRTVEIVDLDPAITELFAHNPLLTQLNSNALNESRVRVINADAMKFLESGNDMYDAIFIDLPDPSRPEIAKLYSTAFYRLALRHLAQEGVLVTQATSPLRSREAFWCIISTLRNAAGEVDRGQVVEPLHVYVPTFGEWGFGLVRHGATAQQPLDPKIKLRFLTNEGMSGLHRFPPDLADTDEEPSTLDRPRVQERYQNAYNRYFDDD
ncbi:MAG: polyamine aminopropyltransferase [Phycisphaerae bacterium]